MVGRNAQRCRSFSECAAFSSVPAREYPAAVSEKVLIRKGERRDASTNCTAASSRTYEPLRICRGALCCSIDVGLCPVRASIATARSARLHARSWIRGRPKLCLLAWSRLWVWDWVWRGLLGPSIRLLRYSLRSIWASGVWVAASRHSARQGGQRGKLEHKAGGARSNDIKSYSMTDCSP
jgi:hypothetical protein